jgi:hypothetical protein
MSEKSLHRAVCDYLRYQYPGVLFNSDLSGSMKLSMHQAVQLKSLRNKRGYPDLMIYEPRGIYHGLFIELKKEGERLYKKNGQPASPHIEEQIGCLLELRMRNYKAEFAVGFEMAKEFIDNYLRG